MRKAFVLQQSTKGGGGVSYEFVLEVSRLHPLTVSAKALRVTLCLVFGTAVQLMQQERVPESNQAGLPW
jgi:hypothetical protein